jgi:hypothetical protein
MTETPPAPEVTPVTWTTRRGIAAWSFCIGLWTTLVFWWYPYSVFAATVGLLLGLLSLVMGWRAGKNGENLALGGVLLCGNVLALTILVYRGAQMFYGDLASFVYP